MLDPQRIGLNAESVGFLKRTRQEVDWHAFKTAMQTEYNNQNSAVDVRRLKETPVNEIHVMGGERNGFASNELLLTQARQQRQLNGYPLRSFSAKNPAVVLPKKYGGFPLYNRNQVEYPELVSVFTEPMSAPLQSDTTLLESRAGALPKTLNSLHSPYEENYYMDPMTQSYDAMEANENEFRQRRHLQGMSAKAKRQRNVGVFISSTGYPISTVQDAASSAVATQGAFALNAEQHSSRQSTQQSHTVYAEPDYDGLDMQSDMSSVTGFSGWRDDTTIASSTTGSSSSGGGQGGGLGVRIFKQTKIQKLKAELRKAGAALHTDGDENLARVVYMSPERLPSLADALVLSHHSDEKTVEDVESVLAEPTLMSSATKTLVGTVSSATKTLVGTKSSLKSKKSSVVDAVRKYSASLANTPTRIISNTLPQAVFIPMLPGSTNGMQPSALRDIGNTVESINENRAMKNSHGRVLGQQRPNLAYDLGRAKGNTGKREQSHAAFMRERKARQRAEAREFRGREETIYGFHQTYLGKENR